MVSFSHELAKELSYYEDLVLIVLRLKQLIIRETMSSRMFSLNYVLNVKVLSLAGSNFAIY